MLRVTHDQSLPSGRHSRRTAIWRQADSEFHLKFFNLLGQSITRITFA
ncbi:hypothetical protein RBSH_04874 [Rhodopirellula baltica SH28]|uniref:Uncharacterized protein n=2 Tax=Rhodopirellula baltica TaxID=265606 RepID=F2AXD6_RHOBT|nr:hypothetical protein RBWH47_01844 [Rhodopirellula baltica WH47]EKJ99790.1 hypothetical protein RBSH_04874 [Rhodopirellula baltica SH28]